jgi:hypothetical protein
MKINKVDNKKFKATFKQYISNSSLENQTDKYLFDRNKTIGFRKDKKMFKFVGLRDGYSKQLEFSIKSIVIDGNEKIAANRVNFNDISLSGNTVVHNINGLDFFNTIDVKNYKNLLKVEEQFNSIDIIYEIHTKGVKIKDNTYTQDGIKYFRQNHLGQFQILDDGNNNILFTIENPIALDSESRIFNILSHSLYKEDDKYYYKKSILDNPINVLPLYIDANVTFNYIAHSNIQSYTNNNNDDDGWNAARLGSGLLYLNTSNNSINSLEQKTSQLFTNWTDTGVDDFDDFYDFNNIYNFDLKNSDYTKYIITNWIDVISGETFNINFYVWDYNSSDNPILIIHESGSTMTTTNYIIDLDDETDINHTCLTGTTKMSVSFNVLSGEYYYIYVNNFIIRKQGITNYTNYYESFLERQLLYFDTSQLYKIAIDKMELSFNLSSPSSGNYTIQKAITASDTEITTLDFNNYVGDPYVSFIASNGSYTLDLGQDIIDDFIDQSTTKLMIREYDYDYNLDTPTYPYNDIITHNWSYQLDIELGEFIVTGQTILNFDLESNGFGVIYSEGSTYSDAYSGSTFTTVVHNSTSGTYESGATYIYDLTNYGIYRTFLNFNTSILSIYARYIIKNVKLVIQNYNYNDDISIDEGLQDTVSGLTSSEFMSFGEHYTTVEGITLDSSVNVDLDGKVINTTGNTLFVIRNKEYDYEEYPGPGGMVSSLNGMDFSKTYLQLELEPYLIYGIEYIKIQKGENVNLYASRNTDDGEIFWSVDSGFTNIIGYGNVLNINTIFYNQGDIIYAGILDSSGNTISQNILSIYLDLYDLNFNKLPERNFNIHNVDIDSVYFKYHKCLSGTTYAYVRELDDVYEQSYAVSDSEETGSYNMYNEFDIIDEFFSNSHEVEVVGRLDDINLNVSQKRINDVYIHEGTRVLLISSIPTENDGIYIADYNLKLHKTSELDTEELAFRYKTHVNAGEFLDFEFHTMYYTPSGTTYDDWNYLDPIEYGVDYFDLSLYSEYLYDGLTS